MLKRLELVGFKSFADKTSFDFAPGVTGVVGPNGSGKSNVVDAVRWVLGEQSAKSMRGGEMTDVIFNGSASRRGLGMAEVSMVFDNSKKVLATDAEEVRITRRVYRSGEGEYLINGQPVRLKDVKDLFLGSGAGTDAYCIIQQGQVDVLLQTAPKERRTIFEEAAGISRFKARKVEAMRRLERVDSNLQRLRDVLEEVEKQLRSVKLQASKAQKHQELSARLKELRLELSLREYHRLDGSATASAEELARMKAELSSDTARADDNDRELAELDARLAALDAAVRSQQAALSQAEQRIASERAGLGHERAACAEVERDRAQTRQRSAGLTVRLAALGDACEAQRQELDDVEAQCRQQKAAVEAADAGLDAAASRHEELRAEIERQHDESFAQSRRAGQLHNEATGHKAHLDTLCRERDRLLHRTEQASADVARIDVELQGLTAGEEHIQQRLAAARADLHALRAERDRLAESRDETAAAAADLRARRSGLLSRIEVLEGLERSHEGLGTGVREVFAHLGADEPGPWRAVAGLVADLLAVRREFAPLIDLALGDRSQRFVVHDAALLGEAIRKRGKPFSGRVSFLFLDAKKKAPPRRASTALTKGDLVFASSSMHPGIVAPAEAVAKCEDERFADLPRRLLGDTVIVHDLVAARAVAGLGAGVRCVTLAGELVEPDGSLTIGTHHAEAGILSRKSELRELRQKLADLDVRLAEFEQDLADLKERLARLDSRLERAAGEADVLAEQAADMRRRIDQHEQRRANLSEEVSLSQSELGTLEEDVRRSESDWRRALDQAVAGDAAAAAARKRQEDLERESRELEARRERLRQDSLAGRVALAQTEERLASAAQTQQRLRADLREREDERARTLARLAALDARLRESELAQLRASAALAEASSKKESAERLSRQAGGEREGVRGRRQAIAEEVQASRSTWRQRQEAAHATELAVADLSHKRSAIAARLADDYQIDLEALYRQCVEREAGWFEREGEQAETAPEDEIVELRKRLAKLGSVNLESIAELAEVEARHEGLRQQYDDVAEGQKVLQEVIARINGDSRRMFSETFATVREHFQELFRKLFGGGMADMILEEGVDVLESGIEIVARPPGKELRSISLMSGGEKTMTAVALLMAIFKSKPSPFCILDEVDAALDEANVGRFTAVLRDFLSLSQFIVVTHHKRTMSAADVLYGVTMAEAGVSSRYAVKFEDWPDDERQAA